MNKYCLLLFCSLLFTTQVSAQQPVRERVYVQTDKQLYMAGELLWMKLYTTDAEGRLMGLSKAGYVELLSDSIPEAQVTVDINDGAGAGWIELSHTLPTGYYRLIAYTRNMRNESPQVYFEKTIRIINPYIRNEEIIMETDGEQSVQFLPPSRSVIHEEMIITDRKEYQTQSKGEIRLTNLPAEKLSLAISIAGAEPGNLPEAFAQEWKNKLPSTRQTEVSSKYIPEYEGPIIDGRLIDLETGEMQANKAVNTLLLAFPGKDIQLFGGQMDDQGQITFFTHQTSGRKEIVTATHAPYEKQYRIDIDPPFVQHETKQLPALRIDSTWQSYLEERNLAVQVVEAYTSDSLSRIKQLPTYFNHLPYKEYILDEYTRFNRMDEIFIEFITTARIRKENGKRVFNTLNERMDAYTIGKTLVLLDNIPVPDHELIASYNPLLVNKISIYLGRYIIGGQPHDGIISFSTYNHNYPGITFGENIQLFDYEGPQSYRYFYAPAYGEEQTSARMPDFRHTLLWEPSLWSDGEKEITIPFYTSGVPGIYRITVEGISAEGTVVSATKTIEVKE